MSAVVVWGPPNVKVPSLNSASTLLPFLNLILVPSTVMCSVANVPTVTSLVKNALSVNNPNPGLEPT